MVHLRFMVDTIGCTGSLRTELEVVRISELSCLIFTQ